MIFDTILIVDWSGGNDTGPKPRKDAIWACIARNGKTDPPVYLRNRLVAEDWIEQVLQSETDAGRRVFAGFDFNFGFPKGFVKTVTGSSDPLAFWAWLDAEIQDDPKGNNRFEVAGALNQKVDGVGPFWGNGRPDEDVPHLPRKGRDRSATAFPERRMVETKTTGTFAVWQLAGAGAVGSQSLMGLPVLHRLRQKLDVAVWPFEPLTKAITFAEIWPSLIGTFIRQNSFEDEIKDAAQVRLFAQRLSHLPAHAFEHILSVQADEEGWIFGVGHEQLLGEMVPPLRNDCFALPQGVDWTPVDDALSFLQKNLHPIVGAEDHPLEELLGRVLAAPVWAKNSNPPFSNAAIDGYGFCFDDLPTGDVIKLPLVEGRAAAGQPLTTRVPVGKAVRVLTGAQLPHGVDTLVLQEDVVLADGQIVFRSGIKRGANTRKVGEDFLAGTEVLSAGHKVQAQDLAMLSACGTTTATVFRPLKVGILSTGDELTPIGEPLADGAIYDANRPMLSGLLDQWGFDCVDFGRAPDTAADIKTCFDKASGVVDALITTGGASAGDEDHVSRLLKAKAELQTWRIAIKPGRPLALALWQGMPVFGLPGNPVAAFVCALRFGYPALCTLSGRGWTEPRGYFVPAGFEKRKKPGRRELLRARLRNEQAEVFTSEGSGRISGLSWSEGLVELPDGEIHVQKGDPVLYYPYSSFGLAGA